MTIPTQLADALNVAATNLANAEIKEWLLRSKALAKYGCDKSDPKYPQYKQAHKEAEGATQTARNAMGPPKQAVVDYYRDNPDKLDELLGID